MVIDNVIFISYFWHSSSYHHIFLMHFFLMILKRGELCDLYGYVENMQFLKIVDAKRNSFLFSKAYFEGELLQKVIRISKLNFFN